MIKAGFVFILLGLFAIVLGASGFGGLSIDIGKLLFFSFIALSFWSSVVSLFWGKKPH
jgi:uncharacterized membrane protein YtjA (UPF0391 family)